MSFVNLSDTHEPKGPEVFLDTSIFVSKQKGPLFTKRIRRVCKLFDWRSTSSYAKTEYGNVILAPTEFILRTLKERKSLAATVDWLAHILPEKYHKEKQIWGMTFLTRVGGDSDKERTERAELSLTRLMKLGVRYIEAVADKPIENGTDCYWAKIGVQTDANGNLYWEKPDCVRSKPRCRIHRFFAENKDLFVRIKNHIDGLSGEKSAQLKAFSDVISKATADSEVLLDYKTGCRSLADALIAVDSRSYGSMFSMNKAESDALTIALRQDFYYLPANPERNESGILFRAAPAPAST